MWKNQNEVCSEIVLFGETYSYIPIAKYTCKQFQVIRWSSIRDRFIRLRNLVSEASHSSSDVNQAINWDLFFHYSEILPHGLSRSTFLKVQCITKNT